MKSYLPAIPVFIGLAVLIFALDRPVWSRDLRLALDVPSASTPLGPLVQQFLLADSDLQAGLKDKILAHPDGNLENVRNFIQDGFVYGKEPVGILRSQAIQVNRDTYHYGLYVPEAYDPSLPYPLIICLHGAGFSGDTYLERWVPRLKGRYILLCPSISRGAWWTRHGEELVLATLRSVRSRYHVDSERIFLTGMSNGGIGAWIIGMHRAPIFAGIAPMASGIDKVLYPFLDNLKQTSVYVIHGVHDQIMPVSLSQDLVNEMNARKIKHVYREHTRSHPHAGGHFFPREELPSLVAWFDEQRRKSFPRHVNVIRDATHLGSFYWVRIDATDRIASFSENLIDSRDEYIEGRVYAKLQAKITAHNYILVTTNRVRRYSLFLNEALVDFSTPVTVETNGKISYQERVQPSLNTLLQQARLRQDPKMLFPIHLVINVNQ